MPKNPHAERDNPCLREQELTYKCLAKHPHDECELFFVNYNNCKDFWNKVRSERRSKGIVPYLPPVEERASIKAKYMQTKPSSN